ncbi:MAG TPA: AraC family transcriptional regulator [Lachnospiraceae bacterium]|nr:AraC family transcriptional regulator [Lachnospiraceae bacterium]
MHSDDYLQNEISIKLRPVETSFKELYIKYPDRKLSFPHETREISDIISAADTPKDIFTRLFSTSLTDSDFIQTDVDIAIFQHIRYLPANWHKHNFFEIACVISGSVTNYIVNQEIPLTAGDICIVAPNMVHAVSAFSDDGIMLDILLRKTAFEKNFLALLPEDDILTSFFTHTLYDSGDMPYLIFKTDDDPDIQYFISALYHEFNRNRQFKKNMMNSILSAFFIVLMRNHEKDVIIPTVNESVMNENLIFMLRYMQENYEWISLQHLADFFNYSPRHVQRIITTATGCSFSENILKLKMKHAAELLRSALTISEIAEKLGYYDASSFRQAFKSYYLMTPNDYRSHISG